MGQKKQIRARSAGVGGERRDNEGGSELVGGSEYTTGTGGLQGPRRLMGGGGHGDRIHRERQTDFTCGTLFKFVADTAHFHMSTANCGCLHFNRSVAMRVNSTVRYTAYPQQKCGYTTTSGQQTLVHSALRARAVPSFPFPHPCTSFPIGTAQRWRLTQIVGCVQVQSGLCHVHDDMDGATSSSGPPLQAGKPQ